MRKKQIGLLLSCMIAVLLGISVYYYPNGDAGSINYSTDNVRMYLKEIAKEPHSTLHHPEALEETRNYIVSEMRKMGIESEHFQYADVKTKHGETVEINNIYGKIDGKDGENGSYILLMAHYDSGEPIAINNKGYSFGAADDGYGVATILETIRVIKQNDKQMVNGIKVLLTDGEEIGLLGSEKEFQDNPSLYENVAYVINLEARGTGGPAMLIQTSADNSRVLELYNAGHFPMTNSLITDLYKGSGRSDFLHADTFGIPGINYAVIDKVENYHTPEDSYLQVSDYSLNHYRDQIVPIVERFVYSNDYSDVNYFKEGTETIFFTIFPDVLVTYPTVFGIAVSIVLIIGVIVLLYIKRQLLRAVLKKTLLSIIQLVAIAGFGYGISYLLAQGAGITFDLGYMCKVPGDDLLLILLPILLGIIFVIYEWRRHSDYWVDLLSCTLIYGAFLSISILVLPGSSYLFGIPILLILPVLYLHLKLGNDKGKYILIAPLMASFVLWIPLMYMFNMAFSIGALGMNFALVTLIKVVVMPILKLLWD